MGADDAVAAGAILRRCHDPVKRPITLMHRGASTAGRYCATLVTAPAAGAPQADAEAYGEKLLDELGYVGVLALELFDVGGRLLANEFAPRVHNTGHWTIEGAATSQFENHLRAVLGLPREKAQAWLFRPESSGMLSDLRPDDVVLLTGEATDRFTTVVRDAHLSAGCTLAWVEGPAQLEAALAHVRPTHVLLDHGTAKVLEEVLEAGQVDGVAWHDTPQEVLEATSARVAEARLTSKARKLAAEIPAARLETIAGAAHMPSLEQPAVFAELVLGFLAEAL